jgi:putative nucleotidyltransferase with HDIG domain
MHPCNGNKVPSSNQCYNLLKRYAVPDNIIRHSEVVSRVAVFLTVRLNRSGENLHIDAVKAAALLHDITKMEGIESRQDHAKTGRRLLAELGYRRIGDIVGEHIRLQAGRENHRIREEEIINYADKRVMHTQIVTLKERFADLRKRYGLNGLDNDSVARITALEERTYELERTIFSRLDFSPEELLQRMEIS